MKKFSVILLTYNSKKRDVKLSLDSILMQKMTEYELIIADDGSKVNNKEFIIQYFREHNFKDYKLIMSPTNRGTVINLLNAVELAAGEYFKGIGAGDLLYADNTLQEVYRCMSQDKMKFLFGRMIAYEILCDHNVRYMEIKAPLYEECYQTYNQHKIKKNLLIYDDYILGASIFLERDYGLKQLKNLSGKVIFCEDFIRDLAALEGEKLNFLDDYLVLYQYYTGISTIKKPNKGKMRIRLDRERFLEELTIRYPKDKIIRRGYRFILSDKIKNRVIRIFCKVLLAPRYPFDSIKSRKRLSRIEDYKGFRIEE